MHSLVVESRPDFLQGLCSVMVQELKGIELWNFQCKGL